MRIFVTLNPPKESLSLISKNLYIASYRKDNFVVFRGSFPPDGPSAKRLLEILDDLGTFEFH